MLEEERDAAFLAAHRDVAHAVDEACPRVAVRRLERVVVALDAGPEDHVRADRRGEVGRAERLGERRVAHRVVGRREAALAEQRVQVGTGRDRVDAMAGERLANVVEVLLRELLRVVELVVVDEVTETLDCAPDALGHGLVRPLGLVAARDEAGHHRAEGPDAE